MPTTKKQPTRKRLKRGRDWHAWAFRHDDDDGCLQNTHPDGLSWWAEGTIPLALRNRSEGKWVRVLFTEVKASKKGE